MNKTYLGDAVYVELSDYGEVILTVDDGIQVTNHIVLEPEVLNELIIWLNRLEMINMENK